MTLNLLNRQRTVKFHVQWVRGILEKALETTVADKDAEVTIAFLSDSRIRVLNKEWRGIDASTDCLSFPMQDEKPDPFIGHYLGDIAISLQTAENQADIYFPNYCKQKALVFEVTVLFVHSLLHLLGYDHNDDKAFHDMSRREVEVLTKLFPDAPEGLTQRQ